jgi:hypothetical protein
LTQHSRISTTHEVLLGQIFAADIQSQIVNAITYTHVSAAMRGTRTRDVLVANLGGESCESWHDVVPDIGSAVTVTLPCLLPTRDDAA